MVTAGTSRVLRKQVGAWQVEKGGIWFGKTFYDGEGTTGVGAVGFLSTSGHYSFLTIPELHDWSADTILVEPDTLWVGLVNHPEGPLSSGGLLEYDRRANRAGVHKVPGVIHSIVRVARSLFVGTTYGLYVLDSGGIIWHHMEPDASGRLVLVSEALTN